MKLEIDIPKHQYNNIMALDSVNLGRAPYKGIIMYAINAIKHGRVLEQEPRKGHWICDGKGRSFADYHCSECGLKLALCGQDIKQRQDSGYSLFCGGCGADMREVEE